MMNTELAMPVCSNDVNSWQYIQSRLNVSVSLVVSHTLGLEGSGNETTIWLGLQLGSYKQEHSIQLSTEVRFKALIWLVGLGFRFIKVGLGVKLVCY